MASNNVVKTDATANAETTSAQTTPSASPTAKSDSRKRASDDKSDALSPDQEHALHQAASEGAALVDISVFVARHHLKRDQLAGFVSYVRLAHQGRKTVEEWEQLLSAFNSRTVG